MHFVRGQPWGTGDHPADDDRVEGMAHQSQRFKMALLRKLLWEYEENPGDWTLYTEAMDGARAIGIGSLGLREDLAYGTLKLARAGLVRDGYVEQQKQKGHFHLRLTDKGVRMARKVPEELPPEDASVSMPTIPFRVGKGHMLPPKVWKALINLVQSGEVDLVVIPNTQNTKTRYWGEK